mmetsp:Transcript_23322/g.44523  ORF Transcript_23322/g.44523 Transcript_23322/m.44523 type:complete len:265 (-) Transcript_23322:401-1195(-)
MVLAIPALPCARDAPSRMPGLDVEIRKHSARLHEGKVDHCLGCVRRHALDDAAQACVGQLRDDGGHHVLLELQHRARDHVPLFKVSAEKQSLCVDGFVVNHLGRVDGTHLAQHVVEGLARGLQHKEVGPEHLVHQARVRRRLDGRGGVESENLSRVLADPGVVLDEHHLGVLHGQPESEFDEAHVRGRVHGLGHFLHHHARHEQLAHHVVAHSGGDQHHDVAVVRRVVPQRVQHHQHPCNLFVFGNEGGPGLGASCGTADALLH